MKKVETIDEYLNSFPEDVKTKLQTLRQTIQQEAPEASEKISYGMPAFNLNGRYLIYFGAFKNHISLFPASSAATAAFEKDLIGYETSKGTIKFTLDKPLPLPLISKIVAYRVKENLARKKKK
jgi:uncharacterized protein YdhG (YjbR/CyaY superfamily)